ncbi:hypothetical protein CAPTEDRAFT_224678 [Capitella teleta]|uniref:Biotin-protein ligase N-terminal domain-containing protein n=1 Tax=Capitella teleta TaxID=283909 RepID=R7TXH2_CAPTE|nr:hypothetical protein CAPTEDRAFT_224678 [Capitella teleta]|eukprot:ELT98424.1 hypothetical protein CAPTEDRAFT_224678 [Capitella teleta]
MVRRKTLFVYEGLGGEELCVQRLCSCLGEWAEGTSFKVEKIHPEDILKGGWQERSALMAFPGGYDSGFLQTLGQEGQHMIREYVASGGSYLGICAGGYFGSANIEFDKGGPLEVCGARKLKFFPGHCIGPVFPGFQYGSTLGAHAAIVDIGSSEETKTFSAYFNGGGKFVLLEPSPDVQVVGSYAEVGDKPAAIVLCEVGEGRAVLSGVHWEFRGADLDAEDPNLEKIIPLLEESEKKRRSFVSVVMKMLQL